MERNLPSSPNERPRLPSPFISKTLNIPCDFIKELHQVDRMSGGAGTVVESGEVSCMSFVVRCVDVLYTLDER